MLVMAYGTLSLFVRTKEGVAVAVRVTVAVSPKRGVVSVAVKGVKMPATGSKISALENAPPAVPSLDPPAIRTGVLHGEEAAARHRGERGTGGRDVRCAGSHSCCQARIHCGNGGRVALPRYVVGVEDFEQVRVGDARLAAAPGIEKAMPLGSRLPLGARWGSAFLKRNLRMVRGIRSAPWRCFLSG
jgi:hypothetical protein